MSAVTVSYTPPPTVENFIREYIPSDLFYNFIVGPFGCLAPETLVLTEEGAIPIGRITRPMRVLSWNATTRQFQLSRSSASFLKGTDYLYRVTTASGEFDAAGQHLLLCADGEYRRVEDLRQGDVLASYSQTQLLTSAESCQSASPSDAPHYRRTREGYSGGCGESAHHDDRLVLQAEDSGREFAPQPAGVPGFLEYFSPVAGWRAGAPQAPTLLRTRSDLFAGLQQSCRSAIRSATRAAVAADRAVAEFFSRAEGVGTGALRFLQNLVSRPQERRRNERFLPTEGYEASQAPSLTISERPILAVVRRDVKQEFWDIQVAGTNNYVTVDGCVHHNSGKTTGNFFKIIHMAMLQEPSPLDGKRKVKVVVVRNTAPQLRDTTIPSFFLWFKDGQAGTWRSTDKDFALRFPCEGGDVECDILFRPLDTPQDVARVLSLEVTFAVLDEFVEIPKEIVEALSARCGRFPQKNEWPETIPDEKRGATNYGMWGASNPGDEDNWWHDYLTENRPANVSYYHQPSGLSDAAENLGALKGGRKYYENLAVGKTPAWIKQFIDAEWGHSIAGKPVVPTFSREIHVSKVPLRPDPYLPLVIGYDPGVRHSALIFGQMDFFGRLHIVDELILEGYGTERMITDRLLPMIQTRFRDFEIIFAPDPAANSRTPTNETSVVDVLKHMKWKKRWTVKVADTNLLTPRLEAMEHFTTRLTEKGPALVIDPKCKAYIRALAGGWRYTTKKKGEDTPVPDKNVHSHPGDGGTYLAQYFQNTQARVGRRTNANPVPIRQAVNSYHMR